MSQLTAGSLITAVFIKSKKADDEENIAQCVTIKYHKTVPDEEDLVVDAVFDEMKEVRLTSQCERNNLQISGLSNHYARDDKRYQFADNLFTSDFHLLELS